MKTCILFLALLGLANAVCDSGWNSLAEVPGKCFKFFSATNTRDEAQAVCVSNLANLAMPKGDAAVVSQAYWTLPDATGSNNIWLGLIWQNNQWEYIDGSGALTSQSWATGEPSSPGVELATELYSSGKWNDILLTSVAHGLCEKNAGVAFVSSVGNGRGTPFGVKPYCACSQCQGGYTGQLCDIEPQCSAYSCNTDARALAGATAGNDFATCCECTFGQKPGFAFVPTGQWKGSAATYELTIDVPEGLTVQSITWKAPADGSLAYADQAHGLWVHKTENECRTAYVLDEPLTTLFGPGSTFVLEGGDRLVTQIRVVAAMDVTTMINGKSVTYERTNTQDVPIQIGLQRTRTVTADITLHPSAFEEVVYVTGFANDLVEGQSTIELTIHIETPSCIEKRVTAVGGTTHITNEEATLTSENFSNGMCQQEMKYTFKPTDYFEDTITLEFETKVTGTPFRVDAYIEYKEASLLDAIPFEATMTFYEVPARITPETEFKLGSHVYGRIVAKPLVGVPIENIEMLDLVTKQTDTNGVEHETPIISSTSSTYSYAGAYVSPDKFDFEFDLESLHFFYSVSGYACTVEADIQLTYVDGSVVRRRLNLNRMLEELQGNQEAVVGEFLIFDEEEYVGVLGRLERTLGVSQSTMAMSVPLFLGGAAVGYNYLARQEAEKSAYITLTPHDEI
jgi:hypothetical protein